MYKEMVKQIIAHAIKNEKNIMTVASCIKGKIVNGNFEFTYEGIDSDCKPVNGSGFVIVCTGSIYVDGEYIFQ